MLAVYVSGHGYGHATRTGEVLRALRRRQPSLPIAVITSAPERLFRRAVAEPLYRRLETDVGLVQGDALTSDEPGTAEAWRRFAARWPGLVEQEASWLRANEARLVLGDIPPLAFAAAASAGLPAVALGNFSWDWIYSHLAVRQPALAEAATQARAAYARASLLLKLPFAGDLSAFPVVEEIPLVARRPVHAPDEVRRRLGLPDGLLVLLSFGGIGLPGFRHGVLADLDHATFVEVAAPVPAPPNLRFVEPAALDAAGCDYPDLLGAADVVVSKPGYGIVSDAIGAGVRLLYTERGDFPEYPILVDGMSRCLPVRHVSNDDLLAGRIGAPLQALLGQPRPTPPRLDGAERAAESLGMRL